MRYALVGNQNCGKSTLFNRLTGENQHVGNFPGQTMEEKTGHLKNNESDIIIDLPGIYSLSPYSKEEILTREYLLKQKPDCIINIIDANTIERSLYLSLQLIELNIPMVIALNMMDVVYNNGGTIKIHELSEELGVPVVPITASKNQGINELVKTVKKTAEQKLLPIRQDFCSGAIHRTLHAILHLIEDHAEKIGVAPRFTATKLVEGDQPLLDALNLNENELDMIDHSIREMEKEVDTDRKAAIADMRYEFIGKICKKAVIKPLDNYEHTRSLKIDKILTHRFFAIPIFLCIMLFIFWITFSVVGTPLSELISSGISVFSNWLENIFENYGLNPIVTSLVIDGALTGIGIVLSFVPIIVTLFFFLSLLEDTGYMARVAFIMDKLLRKIGLSGRSFVPMLIGFGCSVPAIMATRSLPSERDRKMTILLTPFMSCSAKLLVYAFFTAAFFTEYQALIMFALYLIGIILAIIIGLISKKTFFRGEPVPFVMELPNYRLPSFKSTVNLLWSKAWDYISQVFTVIFIASIAIWFLQTFDTRLNVVSDSSESILALLGQIISPIFTPLGFGDWKAATALISGFISKETIISSFAVLMGTGTTGLTSALSQIFTPLTAFTFLIFTLLYTPCIATITIIKKETHSWLTALGVMIFQILVAWIVAYIIHTILIVIF
jgi:ferrous iron transport protein B